MVHFETGDIPDGSNYADIFESNFNLQESHSIASGSLELMGDVTASYFTGSFVGDGSQLYNLPTDSEWYDGGTFITSSKNVKTSGSYQGVGYVSIAHGATLSGGSAALYLGTTNSGMDIVRLSDSSLVLGGITQLYGWRIFGIKHGAKWSRPFHIYN